MKNSLNHYNVFYLKCPYGHFKKGICVFRTLGMKYVGERLETDFDYLDESKHLRNRDGFLLMSIILSWPVAKLNVPFPVWVAFAWFCIPFFCCGFSVWDYVSYTFVYAVACLGKVFIVKDIIDLNGMLTLYCYSSFCS